jgi:hypothetical protein
MLLDTASPLVREGRIALPYLGEVSERPRLDRLIQRMASRIASECSAAGLRPRSIERAESDGMAFPSIRELGRAAAVALVIDDAAPAELVRPRSGYLVPFGARSRSSSRSGRRSGR